ncbi:MAG: hypothetical protein D3922_14185, partial [Candidatus Electrothrix sp. AR1]|nr:hypothetical protein [Candidatus Electrothrix sp. AR1]
MYKKFALKNIVISLRRGYSCKKNTHRDLSDTLTEIGDEKKEDKLMKTFEARLGRFVITYRNSLILLSLL